jgi:rod shape-determining protein MreC
MERVISRHRAVSILVVVLFAQIIGLAVQVRRPAEGRSVRLIRIWTMAAISPVEKGVLGIGKLFHNLWSGYIYLHGARKENEALKQELEQIRLQQVRDREDASQARRLQALLAFKEQFVAQTVAAQVIGTGAGEQSRVIYLDRGSGDGVKPDMAVVTAGGIVGKTTRVISGSSAQVLLINDQLSGVGAMLEKSRLQGIVNGTPSGTLVMQYVMSDEKVEPGELVLASGGDRVFPKGMRIGRVKSVTRGTGVFYNIELQPAADLGRLEEVLIITRLEQRTPDVQAAGATRASDILAERLPTVPPPPKTDAEGNPLPAANQPKPAPGAANAPPTPNGLQSSSAAPPQPPKPKKVKPVTPPSDTATPQASGDQATATQPGGANAAPGEAATPKPPKPKKNATDEKKNATDDKKPQPPSPDGTGGAR